MKNAKITLEKSKIYLKIDSATYKRVDASMADKAEREQSAISSDTEDESVDSLLINDYCNRRDARIRARMKFCLVSDESETLSYSNDEESETAFVYDLSLADSTTKDDVKVIGRLLEEYIIRGSIYDWYVEAGIKPSDNEELLNDLEDKVASTLRGKAWGTRPLQPFGPAMFNYADDPLL